MQFEIQRTVWSHSEKHGRMGKIMDIWGKVWTDNDKNGHNKNGRMVKRMEK